MRYLKKLLSAVLIYIAAFLPFIAILQAVTGYDYSPAYAAVTGVGAVELIVGCVIKTVEAREESKLRKEDERDAGEYP
jgi:multidrug transporter EmrE-like cation transporter